MAGNTGKLSTEELLKRGPRMRLTSFYDGTRFLGLVVSREGEAIVNPNARLKHRNLLYRSYAKSFTLSYLLRCGRAELQFRYGRISSIQPTPLGGSATSDRKEKPDAT
jgi:hypothetical protein